MTRPSRLPADMAARAFGRRDLDDRGIWRGRARAGDIDHPFHGVYAPTPPRSLLEHCHAYAVRMRPGQAFGHATAALLHGLPLPRRLESEIPLHVIAVRPSSPPRTRGVVGHRLMVGPVLLPVDGLAVCAPSEAWIQLGGELTLDESIAVADHLLTVSPLSEPQTRRLLERRIAESRRRMGPLLRAALAEARSPVRSPGETRVRLLLVRAGIREPALNAPVQNTAGVTLGHADLVWTAERLLLEYEGDGHRTDRDQFRRDIERYEAFRDAGWEVIRVTADDLVGCRRAALVDRVRRRLAARADQRSSAPL